MDRQLRYLSKGLFFLLLFFGITYSAVALDPGHDVSELSAGSFSIGNFTFVDSLAVIGQLNATTLCIGSVCADSWASYVTWSDLNSTYALNDTFSQYDTWNFNQSINLQAWVLNQGFVTSASGYDDTSINGTIASINLTANIEALNFTAGNQSMEAIEWVIGQGYATSVSGYDDTSINATITAINNSAVKWNSLNETGYLTSLDLNLTYAINDSLSQYDVWNFNQSIDLQAWVIGQGYTAGAMNSLGINLTGYLISDEINKSYPSWTTLNLTGYLTSDDLNATLNVTAGNQSMEAIDWVSGQGYLTTEADPQIGVVTEYNLCVGGGGGIATCSDSNLQWNGNYFSMGGSVTNSKLNIAGDINITGGMSAVQYCLGSSCITSWWGGGDNTNIAYLNNTQTFTLNQTMSDSLLVQSEINATIYVSGASNWYNNGTGLLIKG
jgi:hypothetical protein